MKITCGVDLNYNDIAFMKVEMHELMRKDSVKIFFHNSVPILVSTANKPRTSWFRLCSDKASVLQLRRLKQILGSAFTEVKELQPEDMDSKILEKVGAVVAAHMDHLLTGRD